MKLQRRHLGRIADDGGTYTMSGTIAAPSGGGGGQVHYSHQEYGLMLAEGEELVSITAEQQSLPPGGGMGGPGIPGVAYYAWVRVP